MVPWMKGCAKSQLSQRQLIKTDPCKENTHNPGFTGEDEGQQLPHAKMIATIRDSHWHGPASSADTDFSSSGPPQS